LILFETNQVQQIKQITQDQYE